MIIHHNEQALKSVLSHYDSVAAKYGINMSNDHGHKLCESKGRVVWMQYTAMGDGGFHWRIPYNAQVWPFSIVWRNEYSSWLSGSMEEMMSSINNVIEIVSAFEDAEAILQETE